MMNFDGWMEDKINGNYGPELDKLDAQNDEQEYSDPVDLYGADGERLPGGYEPYEPNPYDGTYSEM